jgi:hypothetical protein
LPAGVYTELKYLVLRVGGKQNRTDYEARQEEKH